MEVNATFVRTRRRRVSDESVVTGSSTDTEGVPEDDQPRTSYWDDVRRTTALTRRQKPPDTEGGGLVGTLVSGEKAILGRFEVGGEPITGRKVPEGFFIVDLGKKDYVK